MLGVIEDCIMMPQLVMDGAYRGADPLGHKNRDTPLSRVKKTECVEGEADNSYYKIAGDFFFYGRHRSLFYIMKREKVNEIAGA